MVGFLAARSHWRGRFFALFKRHGRAIEEFERALALDGQLLEAWRCVGFLRAYHRAGEHDKAVAE
jgi:hypothetical protein